MVMRRSRTPSLSTTSYDVMIQISFPCLEPLCLRIGIKPVREANLLAYDKSWITNWNPLLVKSCSRQVRTFVIFCRWPHSSIASEPIVSQWWEAIHEPVREIGWSCGPKRFSLSTSQGTKVKEKTADWSQATFACITCQFAGVLSSDSTRGHPSEIMYSYFFNWIVRKGQQMKPFLSCTGRMATWHKGF